MPIAPPLYSKLAELLGKAAEKVPLSVGPGRSIQKAMGKEPTGPTMKSITDLIVPQDPAEAATDLVAPLAAIPRRVMSEAMEAGAKALGKKMKYVAPEIASKKVKKVFHVSPHKFDKFDFSAGKAGTGTGGQMQGAGGYFAESDAVKRHYQDLFASQAGPYKMPREVRDALGVLDYLGFDTPEQAMHGIRQEGKKWTQVWDADPEKLRKQYPKDAEAVDVIENYRANPPAREKPYHTYESLIPAEDDYLLWDAPLSEQSDKVKKAVRGTEWFKEYTNFHKSDDAVITMTTRPPEELTGHDIYWRIAEWAEDNRGMAQGGPNKELASQLLSEHGIRGNKYLDAGSRDITPEYRVIDGDTGEPIYSAVERTEAEEWINSLGPGKGKGDGLTIQKFERPATYNYVVFDEKDADIIKMLASVAPLLAARATGKKKAEAPKP